MSLQLPAVEPYEYLQNKPYHSSLKEEDWRFLDWSTAQTLNPDGFRDFAAGSLCARIYNDLQNEVFSIPKKLKPRSLSLHNSDGDTSSCFSPLSSPSSSSVSTTSGVDLSTLNGDLKTEFDPDIDEKDFIVDEYADDISLDTPKGVNPSKGGVKAPGTAGAKYNRVLSEFYENIFKENPNETFSRFRRSKGYSILVLRSWKLGGGSLGDVKKRVESQFKNRKRKHKEHATKRAKAARRTAKKVERKTTNNGETTTVTEDTTTQKDQDNTTTTVTTDSEENTTTTTQSENTTTTTHSEENTTTTTTDSEENTTTTTKNDTTTTKKNETTLTSAEMEPKRTRTRFGQSGRPPKKSKTPSKSPKSPPKSEAGYDPELWLKNKYNFLKAQLSVKEHPGKWWKVVCDNHLLGRVKVTGICDVEWSDDYPHKGDYREPYHVKVSHISLSNNFSNASWDVTDGGKTGVGVFCSMDGKHTYSSLSECYHILHVTEASPSLLIHKDILKPNN